MLEGIEILNKSEILMSPKWLGWASVGGSVIIAIVIGALLTKLISSENLATFITVMVTGFYMVAMFCTFTDSVHTGRYRYECVINESASMTQIYEKYDVVEQRGAIWVLEDKEGEAND